MLNRYTKFTFVFSLIAIALFFFAPMVAFAEDEMKETPIGQAQIISADVDVVINGNTNATASEAEGEQEGASNQAKDYFSNSSEERVDSENAGANDTDGAADSKDAILIEPTTKLGSSDNQSELAEEELDPVKDYVAGLYLSVLGREPDAEGLEFWCSCIKSGMGAGSVAQGFFNSKEFEQRGLASGEVVEIAYSTFLDRKADAGGYENWKAMLDDGMSSETIVVGFGNSQEFQGLCKKWGVSAGLVSPVRNEARDINRNVTAYVSRLYTQVLGRGYDIDGLNNWCSAILGGGGAGSIAQGFFNSKEFEQRGLASGEVVEIAYSTFLDRKADAGGYENWKAMLDDGMSSETIVVGFGNSQEFQGLCKKWGVSAGLVSRVRNEARDENQQITAFVARMYRIVLGREPDIDGLNCQCDTLLKGTCGGQFARGFFLSKEFSQSGYSSYEAVNRAYKAMLDRDADQSGLENWVAYLDIGMTIDAVLCGFNCSIEFGLMCGKWGIGVGSMSPTLYRDRNFEVTKFVRGGYSSFLARIPSGSELEYWCRRLLCGEGACEVIEEFVGSIEFTSRGLGNEESVRAVYGAMLEREGDAEGVRTWCRKLEEGKTLIFVVDSIADSEEFSALCSKMGVVRRVYLADPYNGAFQGVSSSTPYFIVVDCDAHRVTIYKDKDGKWRAVQIWNCADGAPGMETVKGWFTVGIRGYYFDSGSDRCFYYTQFCGDYLFHSVLYAQTESPAYITDGRLGESVSHGCVRLAVENAQWIYENIPDDTTVYVF